MIRIKNFVMSSVPPNIPNVGWILPLEDGTFQLKVFGANGWTDIQGGEGQVGPQGPAGPQGEPGPKGDKGDTGSAGADGKSVTAIVLTTNETGKVTGGTATLSDQSTVQITVTVGS